jgi:hypothetical protein
MFREPKAAFNNMDFSGRGYILAEDVLNSQIIFRCKYPKEDVAMYFEHTNLFHNTEFASPHNSPREDHFIPINGINFDKFKKAFFPHLYVVAREEDSEDEKKLQESKN